MQTERSEEQSNEQIGYEMIKKILSCFSKNKEESDNLKIVRNLFEIHTKYNGKLEFPWMCAGHLGCKMPSLTDDEYKTLARTTIYSYQELVSIVRNANRIIPSILESKSK